MYNFNMKNLFKTAIIFTGIIISYILGIIIMTPILTTIFFIQKISTKFQK